jgi:hypothetical protein
MRQGTLKNILMGKRKTSGGAEGGPTRKKLRFTFVWRAVGWQLFIVTLCVVLIAGNCVNNAETNLRRSMHQVANIVHSPAAAKRRRTSGALRPVLPLSIQVCACIRLLCRIQNTAQIQQSCIPTCAPAHRQCDCAARSAALAKRRANQ